MSDIKIMKEINWKEDSESIRTAINGKEIIINKKKLSATIGSKFTIKGKTIDELKLKIINFLS